MHDRKPAAKETAEPSRQPNEQSAEPQGFSGGPGFAQSILALQRRHGNRFVQRMVEDGLKAGGDLEPGVESAIQRARGGGQALDAAVRAQMEPALGTDLGGVRVHTGAEADRLNRAVSARAFTTGRDVFFRNGEYNPGSSSGRELIAHELTHVVQQRGAPVQAKLTLGPVDDPAEREADQVARDVLQRSPVAHGPANVLRRKPAAGKARREWEPYYIKIPPGVRTLLQFLRYAEVEIFGRVIDLAWRTADAPREIHTPAKHVGKPILFKVKPEVLKTYGVQKPSPGAKAESDKAYKELGPAERETINAEVDQRYYASTQDEPGSKIGPGEKGKAAIWNSLRDEVLADRQKLAQLPQTVRELLGQSNLLLGHADVLAQIGDALSQLSADELQAFFIRAHDGLVITPADFPRLLSLARKLAALPPEARKDYLGRVDATTTSLADLERAIDRYVEFRKERERQFEEHEAAAQPLLGAEDLYTAYRGYEELRKNVGLARTLKSSARDKASAEESYQFLKDRLREREEKLLAALKHKGFDSIPAFEAALKSYRLAFRTQAVNLALDVLDRYEHMLFEERRKLEKGGAATIAQGIAASRAPQQFQEYRRQKDVQQAALLRMHPDDHYGSMEAAEDYIAARDAAAAAKKQGEAEVIRGSGNDPLIAERNVDLEKLAGLDAAGVHTYLSDLIAERSAKIQEARREFQENPDRVFKLQDLVDATRTLLGIDPSTIYGRSIQDYIDEEVRGLKLSDVALGILAIALTFLVPGGGWLAAAALVGQAGISTYQAYEAYKEYQEQQRDYELGFLSSEPSLFWVGLAIAAAALDIGVTASVLVKESAAGLKALKEPMLDFAGDSRKLPELLARIEAAQGLDLKFKAALAREAQASLAAKEAWKELLSQAGRLNSFLGGAFDPGLAKQFFRALYYSVKRGVNSITRLSADAKFLEIAGDITRMSGAERAQLETALGEVRQLVAAGQGKGMDERSLLGFVDRWAINRGKPGFQAKLAEEMKAWKPLTPEQKRALDALEAQKREVAALYEDKEVYLKRLDELRARKGKTREEIEEIRDLEEQILDLDPKALTRRDRFVPGTKKDDEWSLIKEAEKRLQDLEEAAAKVQLTLYDRLRAAAPSAAAKERALKGAVVDQVGPLKTRPTKLQADHIVSVREISDMDGFADLPWKDQKAIVDMRENLIAMDGAANAAKGDRTWRSWSRAERFYDRSTIEAMAKRESEVRALIQEEIRKRGLRQSGGGTARAAAGAAGGLRHGLVDTVRGVNVRRRISDPGELANVRPGNVLPGWEGAEEECLDAVSRSRDMRPGSMIVGEAEKLLGRKGDLLFSPSRPLAEQYAHDFDGLIRAVNSVADSY